MPQLDEFYADATRSPEPREEEVAAAGAGARRPERLSARGWTAYCRIATTLAPRDSTDRT